MSPVAAMPHVRRRLTLIAALAALVAFAIAPAAASARHCKHTRTDPNKISLHKAQVATLCLLNNERRKRGLARLHENHKLDRASMQHARDMAAHNFFEHGDFVGRIKRADYLDGAGAWTVGENIAWGGGSYSTPAAIVHMWMDSPPHKENILSTHFHEIGIGIARGTPSARVDEGATYATDFGARS